MWSKQEVDTLHELYPLSQIILTGDYGKGHYYQSSLCGIAGFEAYHPDPKTITHMPTDRRSKDQPTKDFKQACRDIIDASPNDFTPLREFLLSRIDVERFETIKPLYTSALTAQDLDYILTGTNERVEFFTKELLHETKNHYLVKYHSDGDIGAKIKDPTKVFLHGEIIYESLGKKTEPRHAFTVHSFQGITIKDPKRLYVDIFRLGRPQDFYTAISRVESLSQIHLIAT